MASKGYLLPDSTGNTTITGDVYLPKTSGVGIKVDTSTPTFGWRDIIGRLQVRGTGSNDPSWASYITNIRQWQFAVNKEIWVEYHMPHDLVPATDLHLHVHWSHNSASVTTGSVTWGFDFTYAKGFDQAAFGATTNTTVQQNGSTTQYQHMIAEVQITAASPSGSQINNNVLEVDGLLIVRAYLSANTLSAATDPFIHSIDVHYQSTNLATKAKAPNFYT